MKSKTKAIIAALVTAAGIAWGLVGGDPDHTPSVPLTADEAQRFKEKHRP